MSASRDPRLDEAGVGPDPKQVRHLTPLHELRKWRVARGEPDVRGWPVFTSNGRNVGRVSELLVDDTIGQVVILDVAVRATGKSVLVPVRAAWVDRDHDRVILDGAQTASTDDVLPLLGRETEPVEPPAERPDTPALPPPAQPPDAPPPLP